MRANLPHRPFSIAQKVSLTTLIIIVIFGFLAAAATYQMSLSTLIKVYQEKQLELTKQHAKMLTFSLEKTHNLVATIAEQEQVVSALNGEVSSEELQNLLISYNVYDSETSISLLDDTGLTIAATELNRIGQNCSAREYFTKALTGSGVIDLAIDSSSDELSYYFSHPVIADNEVVGVTVLQLKPEQFHHQIFEALEQYPWMLTDKDGVIVYATDTNRQFKSIGILEPKVKQLLMVSQKYANHLIEPLEYTTLQDNLYLGREPTVISVHDHAQQTDNIITIAQLGSLPFFVIAEVSSTELNQLAQGSANTISIIVIISAFLALVLIYLITQRLLKPIAEVTNKMAGLVITNEYSPIVTTSKDEIGQLATAFNKMLEEINKSKHDTEYQVAERTQDLQKLNKFMIGRELKMVALKKEIVKLKKENHET